MRIILLTLIVLLTFCGLFAADLRPLSGMDIREMVSMLEYAGLDSTALCFEKDWDLSTRFKSASQMNLLQNPWSVNDQVAGWRELFAVHTKDADGKLWDALTAEAWQIGQKGSGVYEMALAEYKGKIDKQVRKPQHLPDYFSTMLTGLSASWNSCFAELSNAQRDSLAAFWLLACSEGEDGERYREYLAAQKLPVSENLDIQRIGDLYERVNFKLLRDTAIRYLALCEVMGAKAKTLKFHKNKPHIAQTPWGVMIVGSMADDVYRVTSHKLLRDNPVCMIIDPAGNDRYELSINAGIKHPFYLMIDLAGDDVYRASVPGGLFSVNGGVGYSLDAGGNDLYEGDDFFVAAHLGIVWHRDMAGDDVYRAGTFSQGAALFAVAMLQDDAGNDAYFAASQSQGLGSTRGVGIVADFFGADLYYLGGKYYHAPLMPQDFRTLGQGMGFGFRPDFAGGLGLLFDKAGNDKYIGGVYAQGVGYWYATGMLIDEAGNDVYNAVYYPQGSGIHLACGVLYDAGGNDAYYSRNGPGQGAGHDWGMGVLIDGAGNDAYSIHGGNGLGLSNSVGLFVDRGGDDRYERNESQNYGNAAFSRSTGGIGLFLDCGGNDLYADASLANDRTWQKGSYGIGRDVNLYPVIVGDVPGDIVYDPAPDSQAPIDEIFAAASEWEVGSAVNRVRLAREILLSRKDEAVPYALANKMSSKSGLEYRALEALLRGAPEMTVSLYPMLHGADSLAAKNAMSLLASVADSLLAEQLELLLEEDKYVTACLSCLGSIRSERSVEILAQWLDSPYERLRYIVARSLLAIDIPSSRKLLMALRDDPSFLVRTLARNLPKDKW
jgi:hypothetical protein